MLGGTVDGQTMTVTDAPKFAVGDHDLLFVENNGSQFVPLVGIQHGRIRIQKDQSGRDSVLTGEDQPLADVNQLGEDEKSRRPTGRSFASGFQDCHPDAVRQQQRERQTRRKGFLAVPFCLAAVNGAR